MKKSIGFGGNEDERGEKLEMKGEKREEEKEKDEKERGKKKAKNDRRGEMNQSQKKEGGKGHVLSSLRAAPWAIKR